MDVNFSSMPQRETQPSGAFLSILIQRITILAYRSKVILQALKKFGLSLFRPLNFNEEAV